MSYSITASKILRPNSDYYVTVSIFKTEKPINVAIEVGGNQENGSKVTASQNVEVSPDTTEVVKLQIGDWSVGKYFLTAKGAGPLQFTKSTELDFVNKSFSIFIQLDKAKYKPGQKVLFRILVLDAQMKPGVNKPFDVYVADGKGHRVKQWKEIETTNGVFSGDVQLSEQPVLGNWKIFVSHSGQTDELTSKSFEVDKYVLPKFEVSVQGSKNATFNDGILVCEIQAKYTYGKAVKGSAEVSVSTQEPYGFFREKPETPVKKTIPIDGKAFVEFDIVQDLGLTNDQDRTVQVDVTVEEALTGKKQNGSAEVTIHQYKYKMEFIKTSETFKPGLEYIGFLKVSHHDGTPVGDEVNPVYVKHGFQNQLTTTREYKLPPNGMIELSFCVNDFLGEFLHIEAYYLGLSQIFTLEKALAPPNGSHFQAVLRTKNPKINEEVVIDLNSTAPLKQYNYILLGKGNIIESLSVSVPDSAKSHSFKFLATPAMAPTAHVVIYYITDNREVLAEAVKIEFDKFLHNFVEINANNPATEPGEGLELSIEAKPNSVVGILGIDQSVLLLQSGNDITKDMVKNEVCAYTDTDYSPSGSFIRCRRLCPDLSSNASKRAFRESHAVILTNGNFYEPPPRIRNYAYAMAEEIEAMPRCGVEYDAYEMEEPAVKVRKNFPETWLWESVYVKENGRSALSPIVPDTITSWVITGFSLDSVYGLGLIEAPTKVTVFRPFFVSLDLPYSIIRDEIVSIPVVVFNYTSEEVSADVTLLNEGEFEFSDNSEQNTLGSNRTKTVQIKANSGASVTFTITPKVVGYVSIKVKALTKFAGDAVDRKLLVKPEGETHYRNKAILADLRIQNEFNTKFLLDFPEKFVPDSEFVEISVAGDILGPCVSNLHNLIKMPYGCGEQNMLNFVPNVVILKYFKNTRQNMPAIETKAKTYLEKGYQQELTYKRDDGSFSAFGMSDPRGSTWLTAFVAKSFYQAKDYIIVEGKIIEEALDWLQKNQSSDGSFPEVGRIFQQDMQGGAAKGLALTAYTLLTFLETQGENSKYKMTIDKTVDYIVKNLEGLDDTYAITICTFALHLANHSAKEKAFNLLEAKAKNKDDMKFWSKPIPAGDENNPWHEELSNGICVEMTAYAMLTYLERNQLDDAVAIMKWLVSQRNKEGGFASTQDTVIGIYALAKLAEKIATTNNNIEAIFKYTEDGIAKTNNIKVDEQNDMILQKFELPKSVREVEMTANGSGFGIIQVSYKYNLNVSGAYPMFIINPEVQNQPDANRLKITVGVRFIGTEETKESNMTVMEVSLPSGFVIDYDYFPDLKNTPNVKRVETKEGDSVVMLYYDKITEEEYRPTIAAYRAHNVGNPKPVPITVYDYYDSSRRATAFYEIL